MKKAVWLAVIVVWTLLPAFAEENVDLSVIHRIKEEAFKTSKVMDHLFFLTDVYGPRLTGSPNFNAAADWAIRRLTEYGLVQAKLEKWGPFGRSWSCTRFSAQLLEPGYAPLIGIPLAWCPGTNGPVSGEPIIAPIWWHNVPPKKIEEEQQKFFQKYRGKLRGKMVMLSPSKQPELPKAPASKRLAESDLGEQARAPEPILPPPLYDPFDPNFPDDPKQLEAFFTHAPWSVQNEFFERLRKINAKLGKFLSDEGVLVVLTSDDRGDSGTVFGERAGSWDPKDPVPPPAIVLTAEHYNRIARLITKKVPVRVQVDLETKFNEEPQASNLTAEIPGGKRKDELVMVGGHLDSWTGGTGATDNAAGCAVVMEAVRILKGLDLKLDRTVRLALWSGEEQGLLGSKEYVKQHFGNPETMVLLPEHAKLSGYFNLDNGSGKVRGVYLQNNDAMRPLFEAWLAPFKDMGVTTISIRNTGGTDHLPFDAVGLPGFQFIQDPLEYGTRTHHSNMDVYDHVQASDLMQASAVLASVVYQAATRDSMLPRKPLPKPSPKNRE